MEDDVIDRRDSEIVFHIRKALKSAHTAASSGKYVDSCLDMIVCNITPPRRFVEALKFPYGTKRDHVLIRGYSALEYIAGLVPLAPSRLFPIVLQRMPKVFQNVPKPFHSPKFYLHYGPGNI